MAGLNSYLEVLADRFESHCSNALSSISEERALLVFLQEENLLRQPMGLGIEMFLASSFLTKNEFVEKYSAAKLPIHETYREQILVGYDY
jgi:hypothetical protein